MEIIKTIRPGDDGSKRYHDKYGDQLCAVRYRRSPCKNTVYTTVEIIVAQREAYRNKNTKPTSPQNPTEWVALKIAYDEVELRAEVRKIGGRWSRTAKAWVVKRSMAERRNMAHRIVEGLIDQCLDVDI
ncbi:hypothetical protein JF535_00750 [Microbulbifer salipaludis]|uniref:Uncharacterized protein n=1 Tax=Microbulbifer salipaludis TaxID=187980 RepID=A0ABS3E237_9GAMM|nr:hypothetical protein [Microbulbifer salipaludis]MBN8429366.1 hypothetical protein [Microbulbifer salipaludis]